MDASVDRLKSLLAQGRYSEVLQAGKGLDLEKEAQALPWVVGANVFLGYQDKAQTLANEYATSEEIQILCDFFLGIGHTRRSQYEEARQVFARNASRGKASRSREVLFYLYQGLGFYRYFCGRVWLAKKWARRAYEQALLAKDSYGQVLSLDLLGHSQIQAGAVRAGLRSLREAIDLASEVGNGGVVAALRTSLLKYEAQYGIQPKENFKRLERALAELKPEDTYSRAHLSLELARQQILRGQVDEAMSVLNQTCDDIYKHQNRRQSGVLNLRYSLILHLQGQSYQALNLLRATEQSIVPEVDHLLLAQMQGLKLKIFEKLKKVEEESETLNELRQLSLRITHQVNSRILARKTGQAMVAQKGEDPLGDLLDLVHENDPRALGLCLEKGYLGLLPDLFDIPVGEKALLFDLVPGSVTLLSEGNVIFHPKGLNGQLRRFLMCLKEKPRSKEDLVEEVWGYEYDPIRHDVLVYAAATKLRRLLAPFGHWLEYSEAGYQIQSGVRLIFQKASSQKEDTPSPKKSLSHHRQPRDMEMWKGLNHRQVQICEYLKENSFLGVTECAAIFSTSKITASRDLSTLTQMGICERLGRARATRYCLKQSLFKG